MRLFVQIRSVLFCVCGLLAISACDSFENTLKTDRSGGYSKQDYRDALSPREEATGGFDQSSEGDAGDIPHLKPYISQSYTQQRQFPLVSVSVNNSVPLKEVFYQLAEQTEFDIELDPSIRGSMIFTARQRPFDQVVDRICGLAGLRYTLEEGVLRVERDTPYNKVYKLDYLSFVRNNSSSINTSISVVSGDGADTGSSFTSGFESSSDFWTDLDANLNSLLGNQSGVSLATTTDPTVGAVEAGGVDENNNPIFNIGEISSGDEGAADTTGESGSAGDANFVINRQAGLVSVYANQAKQKEIESFLLDLKRSLTAQVLIEAKVLEIALNDSFAAGVDWSVLSDVAEFNLDYVSNSGLGAADAASFSMIPQGSDAVSSFVGTYTGHDATALVRAISVFGTTKALASPRLVVLNNQSSVLNVATNRVFFILNDFERETDDDTNDVTETFDYETRTVPEGVIINVMPSIDLDKGTISLVVRPSVTSINSSQANPFLDVSEGAEVPEVSVQELDTVLNVRSGEAVVIGGLMQDRTISSEEGVPVLGEIPLLGNLFRSHSDKISKTELIIFLKATILAQPDDSVHDTDRDLYRKFSDDRRPLKL